jgi:hypothetical protein
MSRQADCVDVWQPALLCNELRVGDNSICQMCGCRASHAWMNLECVLQKIILSVRAKEGFVAWDLQDGDDSHLPRPLQSKAGCVADHSGVDAWYDPGEDAMPILMAQLRISSPAGIMQCSPSKVRWPLQAVVPAISVHSLAELRDTWASWSFVGCCRLSKCRYSSSYCGIQTRALQQCGTLGVHPQSTFVVVFPPILRLCDVAQLPPPPGSLYLPQGTSGVLKVWGWFRPLRTSLDHTSKTLFKKSASLFASTLPLVVAQ